MNTSFADLFLCDVTPTEPEKRLSAVADQYVIETEVYDRTVCTGPIINGSIMPATARELGLVNRNARQAMDRLCLQKHEFTRHQIRRAVCRPENRGAVAL